MAEPLPMESWLMAESLPMELALVAEPLPMESWLMAEPLLMELALMAEPLPILLGLILLVVCARAALALARDRTHAATARIRDM